MAALAGWPAVLRGRVAAVPPSPQADALLALLHPAWQALIAGCLLVVTIAGIWRLAQRGPSRMVRAVLVTGCLVVAVTVVGTLAVSCSGQTRATGASG